MHTHFIPIKITDKQWADRLVKGEVFMRALHEFGSWGRKEGLGSNLDNGYRGDLYSGVTATFKSPEENGSFAGLPQEMKDNGMAWCLIDESDIRFFKIFSLYRYEFDEEKQEFIKPDPRMKQFGDTAVLITDYCEFIERYGKAMLKAYEKVIGMIGNVESFNFEETRELNPLFCKHESQAYQNELRMVLGELKKDDFEMGADAENANELVRSLEPVKLQLGDISDITIEMPIDDFLNGCLPDGFRCRWPSSGDPKRPSNYDDIVEWTAGQMRNYRSIFVKPAFILH